MFNILKGDTNWQIQRQSGLEENNIAIGCESMKGTFASMAAGFQLIPEVFTPSGLVPCQSSLTILVGAPYWIRDGKILIGR